MSYTLVRPGCDDVVLGRVFCGIGWGGFRPDFALVMGETKFPDAGRPRDFHYYLLDEFESWNSRDYIEVCLNWLNVFNVDKFLCRLNKDRENDLYYWNTHIRVSGTPKLVLDIAEYTNTLSLDYHQNIVREVVDDGLFEMMAMIEHPKTVQYQQMLDKNGTVPAVGDDMARRVRSDAGQMPAHAALGYVMSTFRDNPPNEIIDTGVDISPDRGF